jgi:hypothetical protein
MLQNYLNTRILLTIIILILSQRFSFSQNQINLVDGNLIQFNNNGAWCWYQDERAVIDNTNNKLVIASVASNNEQQVVIYGITTGLSNKYTLASLERDDHSAPALIVRPDGKYLAMYAKHYDAYNSRYKIFDGNSWSSTELRFDWTTIPGGTDYTIAYSNLYYLSAENRMYNFARANHRAPNFLISSDNGDTWIFGGQLTTNSSSSYNKGYYKYWGNGVDRIDFIFTEQHPRDTTTSIYHGYIMGGKGYKSDGTVVDENIFNNVGDNPSPPCPAFWNFTKVFADNTTIGGYTMRRCWNTDVMRYDDGTIATIITARTDTYTGSDVSINPQHAFIYCRYNGSSWTSTYLCRAGQKLYSSEADYTGLSALHPNDPNTIYVSTTYDPRDNTFLSKHEIFKGITADNGATWTWIPITQNSTVDNLRPIVPEWGNNKTALIWFRGTYNSAQNINAEVVGILIDENSTVPVELVDFTANVISNSVILNWQTKTETNNSGFEIERNDKGLWNKIGFVSGKGTTTYASEYSFIDNAAYGCKLEYRLKQIDFDGSFAYSKIIEVKLNKIIDFEINQNFPNPFNPTTTISYSIAEESFIQLKIFDVLGKEIKTLVNEKMPVGKYKIDFNAGELNSGIYFYRIQARDFIQSKKMILIK